MTRKTFTIFFIAAFAVIAALSIRASLAADQIVNVDFPCPTGSCAAPTNIPDYFNTIYQFALGISGLLALGMIVAGGVRYTVSAGNSSQQSEAKSMITSAIWGLVLLFGSYLILNTINPQITKMGLNFSNTPPPESNKSNEPLISSAGCQDFKNIHINPPLSSTLHPSTCEFRKNVLTSDAKIAGGDNKFYDDTWWNDFFGKTIKNGSVIWTYPYYIKGNDPMTAQCLIFAYRELDNKTIMTGLNENLNLCPSQKQGSTLPVCLEWTFTATGKQTLFKEDVSIKITEPVSDDYFNYPDPTTPPPINVDKSNPVFLHQVVPGRSECTSVANPILRCVDAQWSCTKSQ